MNTSCGVSTTKDGILVPLWPPEERMDKLGKLCFSILATNSNQLFPQNLLTQRGMQSIAVREWSGIAAQLLGIQGAS